MIKPRRRYAFQIGLLLSALTVGCGGDVTLPNEGDAANLVIVDGDDQVGPVGAVLAKQIVVRVTDTQDRPVPSQDVAFDVQSGGGSVVPATLKTDGTGHAAAAWTLGPGTGSQRVRVQTARGGSTSMLEVTFEATALAGTGSNLVAVSGDEQTGPVNSALADSLVVRATDALGNPVSGVEVAWTVTGGGSIGPTTVVTGADGLAAAERVLGPTAGPRSAQASVEGFSGSPVTFTHTAVPANPTVLLLVSGDGQTAPGGFEVAEDLVVRLEDDNGNGIGGAPITWVVPAGSGSVDPVNTTTDVNGLGTTRWTLPSAVGGYTVQAVFSGLPPVQFSATATADVPTTIELVSGNGQTASVGSALANPLVVRVTDANDNPVAGVSVNWTAVNGGSVAAATSGTDEAGLAQMTRTLGTTIGSYTTTAAVDGLTGSPITFTSSATFGPPAQLAIVQTPVSPTLSGTAFMPAFRVQIQDGFGNAVVSGAAGIQVAASIAEGQPGASLENTERNTGAGGAALFNNLRITGPPGGNYRIAFNALVGGSPLTPATSEPLTVTAGGATRIVMVEQPSATAQNGVVFPQQPVVQVVDGTGNPVAGDRTIEVELGVGTGTLGGTLTASTGSGSTATFSGLRITGAVGTKTLLFTSGALTPAESNDINLTAGPAASVTIEAGDGQTVPAGSAVPTDPAVIVRDASNNPVGGVTVNFEVTAGGGSVDPASAVTGANGIATVNSWTLGAIPGSNSLTATVPSVDQVIFTATGTSTNSTPTADDDAFSVDEDATLDVSAPGVLSGDTDPDAGDVLTAELVGPAPAGNLQLNPNGSFTYTPEADFNGVVTFDYRANDGEANSNTATVTITVNAVNDAPGFSAGPDVSTSSLVSSILGASHPGWASGISPGPPDEIGQTVGFQVTLDDPGNATAFAAAPQIDADGNLTYRPVLRFDTMVIGVTVVAQDSGGANSGSQAFTITIDP